MRVSGISTIQRSACFLGALAILSGCKPFSDSSTGGCSLANYASSSPQPIGPAQSDGTGFSWGSLAQSFTTFQTTAVSGVALEMETVLATGTLSIAGQSLTLGIYQDSATSFSGTPAPTLPSNTSLGSVTIATDGIPTFPQYVNFAFSSVSLAANTPYWLILNSSLAQGATSYVAWLANTQSNTYATGFALFSNLTTGAFGPLNVYGSTGSNIDFVFRMGCS